MTQRGATAEADAIIAEALRRLGASIPGRWWAGDAMGEYEPMPESTTSERWAGARPFSHHVEPGDPKPQDLLHHRAYRATASVPGVAIAAAQLRAARAAAQRSGTTQALAYSAEVEEKLRRRIKAALRADIAAHGAAV